MCGPISLTVWQFCLWNRTLKPLLPLIEDQSGPFKSSSSLQAIAGSLLEVGLPITPVQAALALQIRALHSVAHAMQKGCFDGVSKRDEVTNSLRLASLNPLQGNEQG